MNLSEEKWVITIGGPPGTGTTTVARAVAKRFSLRYFSTGEVFRNVAKNRGLDVENLSKTAEKEVDSKVDSLSVEEAKQGGVVIESDLAAWMCKDVTKNILKIWLTASLETRANRIFNDSKKRTAESHTTLEDVKSKLEKRFNEDKGRYLKYYGINLDDLSIYDFILDTENLDEEKVISEVIQYINNVDKND